MLNFNLTASSNFPKPIPVINLNHSPILPGMDKHQKLTHGLLSLGCIHMIGVIDPNQLSNIAGLVIQIIIATATLWSMFKKPTPPTL